MNISPLAGKQIQHLFSITSGAIAAIVGAKIGADRGWFTERV